MATAQGSNSNIAIVAIIVVGLLIAGAGVLFYTGAIGDGGGTTIIEAPAKEESGISLKFQDQNGIKTEIKTN